MLSSIYIEESKKWLMVEKKLNKKVQKKADICYKIAMRPVHLLDGAKSQRC